MPGYSARAAGERARRRAGRAVFRGPGAVAPRGADRARPDAKAQLVAEAFSLGENARLLPLAAGLQGDIAASIKPTAANRGMADLFARALLLAGLPDAAARWLNDTDVLQTAVALAAPTPARDVKGANRLQCDGRGVGQEAADLGSRQTGEGIAFWALPTFSAGRCRPTPRPRRPGSRR